MIDCMIELKIKPLFADAKIPSYAKPGDAGLDVFAYETVTIAPGERKAVSTGISSEFPAGYVALVWDRSSVATKKGLTKLSGVIDSGYRGEWKIVLLNVGQEMAQIEKGEKIAQVILTPYLSPTVTVVDELAGSERGTGGFGSTGTH